MTEQKQGAAATQKAMQSTEVVFADENARIAWEVGQAVDKLKNEFPPETADQEFKRISFPKDVSTKGIHAVFTAGTVVGTGQRGVFIVPERTIAILNRLKIPFIES